MEIESGAILNFSLEGLREQIETEVQMSRITNPLFLGLVLSMLEDEDHPET